MGAYNGDSDDGCLKWTVLLVLLGSAVFVFFVLNGTFPAIYDPEGGQEMKDPQTGKKTRSGSWFQGQTKSEPPKKEAGCCGTVWSWIKWPLALVSLGGIAYLGHECYTHGWDVALARWQSGTELGAKEPEKVKTEEASGLLASLPGMNALFGPSIPTYLYVFPAVKACEEHELGSARTKCITDIDNTCGLLAESDVDRCKKLLDTL